MMLNSNLLVEEGLVNGAMSRVDTICYNSSDGPLHLLVVVKVHFDGNSGPTLADGIVPIRRT